MSETQVQAPKVQPWIHDCTGFMPRIRPFPMQVIDLDECPFCGLPREQGKEVAHVGH